MDSLIAAVIGDIALVFVIASLLASLARKCGQPAVIGQIVTGVLLGPSLLGRLPGHLTSRLFPATALPYLNVLAQVAVVLFMFAVGYEVEFGVLRAHRRLVPLVALGALLVPLGLGVAFALLFRPQFASIGVGSQGRSFVLFMGTATAITALPVLASIVRERGLSGTTAGVVAAGSAGLMDVLAWLLLTGALIGTGHPGPFSLPVTVLLLACFVVTMLAVVRPVVSWWTGRPQSVLSSPVPVAFALAMASAWVTASLGLHPIFGAFLAGLTMRGAKAGDAGVLQSLDQAGGMLLPLFFVVTGLSLNVGGVHGDALLLLVVVLVIATVGKLAPGYGLSRLCGLSRRESASVAALVNTRGLTELIALNVGLQAELLNQRLFTVLVLMALLTTFATGPLLSLIKPARAARTAEDQYVAQS